jgi:hypothetical protein
VDVRSEMSKEKDEDEEGGGRKAFQKQATSASRSMRLNSFKM